MVRSIFPGGRPPGPPDSPASAPNSTYRLQLQPGFGFADAAALLGIPKPKWGGSQNSIIPQMVSYMNTSIAAKANGIATTVINSSPADTSFAIPVAAAMNAAVAGWPDYSC